MLTSMCAHCPAANGTAAFEVGARCVAKSMPGSSCEMSIVASNKVQVKELPSRAPTLLRFNRAIALQL
jgi:hypothetical protein